MTKQHRIGVSALALLAIGFCTHAAQAGPVFSPLPQDYGSAIVIGNDGAGCPAISPNCVLSSSDTSSVSASLSDSGTGSSSSATANLALGYVSVSVSGPSDKSGNAIALIWNTLIFSGTSGTSAPIVVNMTGTAALAGDARINATAFLAAPSSGVVSGPIPNYLLSGNGYELFQGVNGDPFTPTYSLAEPFTVTFGVPYILGIAVQAHAGVSPCLSNPCPTGSASIDDPFSFTLPDGVTFTSAFQDSPTTVPEPASWLMFLAGLGGILLIMRCRRWKGVAAAA